MDTESLIKRKIELFAPIEMQIYISDNENDLLLLAANMVESSYRIFTNQYGEKSAKELINNLISINSSTG